MAELLPVSGREEATAEGKEERGRGEMLRHMLRFLVSHHEQRSCHAPTVSGIYNDDVSR